MKRIWKILVALGIVFVLSGTALSGAALAVNPQLRHLPDVKAAQFHEMWQRIYARLDGRTETSVIENDTIAVYEQNDWDTWEEQVEQIEKHLKDWEKDWEKSHEHLKEDENFAGYQALKKGDSFQKVREIKVRTGKWQVRITEDASVPAVTVVQCDPFEDGQEVIRAKLSGSTLKIYESNLSDDFSSEDWKEKVQEMLEAKEETALPVLEILVPQGFEKIQLEIQNGNFTANGIHADEIELEGAGSMEFHGCSVREFDVQNVGSLYFQGDISEKADIKSVSGNIHLLLDGKKEDFCYDMDCVNSTVNLNGTTKNGAVFQLKEGDSSAKKIDIECVVSEVAIAFQ